MSGPGGEARCEGMLLVQPSYRRTPPPFPRDVYELIYNWYVMANINGVLSAKQRLGRISQNCTHIVWKNGASSTSARWRQMDPKPLVVMLAWVVECAEQRKRLDEKYYLVDLEHVNVAGVHKVRRFNIHPADLNQSFSSFIHLYSVGSRSSQSTCYPTWIRRCLRRVLGQEGLEPLLVIGP